MTDFNDKHVKVMEAILPYARQKPQKNLKTFDISYITRKTKILFMLFPEWAAYFPPYNIARLTAVAKQAGYSTDAIDVNIEAKSLSPCWKLDYDPWSGGKDWIWSSKEYWNEIHPHLEPLLESYLQRIHDEQITVVGFSLYYCNKQQTFWFAEQIKKRMPWVTTVVGGPDCHVHIPPSDLFDVAVIGEGEQLILDALEDIENRGQPKEQVLYKQPEGERLDLDALPWADYSHFDLSKYDMPNGVNAEFSRGCTAKCVFCSETHFWKYRGRGAGSTLDEILTLNDRYGIDYVWFLDSLVNGNVNELRAFCKGIIASGKNIRWTGYARCDARMDSEYFDDLKQGGCESLNLGIESGSNAVLDAMNKRITVDIVEANLKECRRTEIKPMANWIVGFPTETTFNFYESLEFLWRNRNCIWHVSTGHGFTEPPDTILSQNSEAYGLIKTYYLNNWINHDFTNSKLHRMIRLLTMNIVLGYTVGACVRPLSNYEVDRFHVCEFEQPLRVLELSEACSHISEHDIDDSKEYQEFCELNSSTIDYELCVDFDIVKDADSQFACSLINEIWPMFRLLWRAHGAYSMKFNITPELAYRSFGDRLADDLDLCCDFKINNQGDYTATITARFDQPEHAWEYSDYSRHDTVAAQRARVLARAPDVDINEKIRQDMDYTKYLQQHMDLSFRYEKTLKGTWICDK